MRYKIFKVGISIFVGIAFYGCSTYNTITKSRLKSPKVYSGTRLNIHTIKQNKQRLKVYRDAFEINPPEHPYLDLPFSFVFDTVLLPLTIPVATNDLVFNE